MGGQVSLPIDTAGTETQTVNPRLRGTSSSKTKRPESVIGLFDFRARVPREVSFKRNDRLRIIKKESEDWLYAENLQDFTRGLVPSSYVTAHESLDAYSWFFGKLSRSSSELMLNKEAPGTFLVRYSETKPGAYVLSVKGSRPFYVRHYLIKYINGKYHILNILEVSDLNEWIEESKTMSKGIKILLGSPCPKIGHQESDEPIYEDWSERRTETSVRRLQRVIVTESNSRTRQLITIDPSNRPTTLRMTLSFGVRDNSVRPGPVPQPIVLGATEKMLAENTTTFNATYVYKNENCLICLQQFKVGDLIRQIKGCYHEACDSCLSAWLRQKGNCPLCKHNLV